MNTALSSVIALPKEHQMEQLQIAYVTAVSALGGATYDTPKADYGIDGILTEIRRFPSGKYCATNFQINCQLKAPIQ